MNFHYIDIRIKPNPNFLIILPPKQAEFQGVCKDTLYFLAHSLSTNFSDKLLVGLYRK